MFSDGFFSRPFPQPSFFSLQDLRDDEVVQFQNSPLLSLEDKLLDKVMELVPLKDRLLKVRSVCHRLSDSVKRSVKSVEFLRDELDYCEDANLSFFFSVYGKHVEHMNYDLFRSCSLREYTQWSWRQSVISSISRCPQLKQIDILVCCRHRLRDTDLQVIFKSCPRLEVLRMDASFINGHSFAKAPMSLRKVELECCQTMNTAGFLGMLNRLSKMTTLHVSMLSCLDEQLIKKIGDMRHLKNLSIVADPDQALHQYRLAEIRRLKLTTLCLDGVSHVTDKFIGDICDPVSSHLSKTLEHLSLAWCKNIGSNGISKLKALPKLKSLNLDGVNKRDISAGLEALAGAGRLERLLLSDDTFVSPWSVVEVVVKCESLRTLDISNNHRLMDKSFCEQLYSARAFSFGKPLVILTDSKSIWQRLPPFRYNSRVEIVNINDRHPELIVNAVSPNTPQQLPRGYLVPDLRRGNRHKMFDYSPNSTVELIEFANQNVTETHNQENLPPGPLDILSEKEQEELARALMELQPPFQNSNWLEDLSNFVQPTPYMLPSISFTDFENSVTVGSAGAPGPPSDKNTESIKKHSRPSRPKRQAQKEKAQQRRSVGAQQPRAPKVTSPSFTEDDFPPLG